MPEQQNDRRLFSLLEVTQSVQRTLADRYKSIFWVKAEINKLNHYPHSGHCYPDLVEKKEGKVIAQLRSILWKEDYHRINHSFQRILNAPLKEGNTMLLCARITFDPVHGLSLRILDIDPVFSLGELEREKQETIEKLKAENLFAKNKSLQLPRLPQRIAIISVETSKGYADFKNVIHGNESNYVFFYMLFPSLLQGERAVESMLYQLKRIKSVVHHFDVVAIIRGGGAEVGLSCFNNYKLTKAIAEFPIPVITGIGHATNETVAELVSYKNAITPTDLANFLMERFHEFAEPVEDARRRVVNLTRTIVSREKSEITNTARYFRSVTDNILTTSSHTVFSLSERLIREAGGLLESQQQKQDDIIVRLRKMTSSFMVQQRVTIGQAVTSIKKDCASLMKTDQLELNNLQKHVENMSPQNVLRRGYSITRINGRSVKKHTDIKPGEVIETILADGRILSEVKTRKENTDE